MWVIFSLLAALSAAIAVICTKAGVKKVDPILSFAIQAVLIILISWGTVFFQKKTSGLAQIERQSWIYLIVAGIVTTLSSLFQFSALKLGNASVVSSLERLSLVFTIILSILFLKEELNWKLLVGAILMIGGAVMISFSRKAA